MDGYDPPDKHTTIGWLLIPELLAARVVDLLWIWEEIKWILDATCRQGENFAKHGLGERVEKGGSVEVVVIKVDELLRSQGIIRCCSRVESGDVRIIFACKNEAHDNSSKRCLMSRGRFRGGEKK